MPSSDRQTAGATSIGVLMSEELRRVVRRRATWIVGGLGVLVALVMVGISAFTSLDGHGVYRTTLNGLLRPLVIPFVAILLGGPLIVEEVEQRTLPYLLLRPIPRAQLFAGKLIPAAAAGAALTCAMLGIVYLGCEVPSMGWGDTIADFGVTLGGVGLATVAYTAVFAALGALFSSSLYAGILYYGVVELVISQLPIIKLVSVQYHLANMTGSQTASPGGSSLISALLSGASIGLPWWVSMLFLAGLTVAMAGVGGLVLSEKQFEI
jgi:ABC-2 type transport system permease protein